MPLSAIRPLPISGQVRDMLCDRIIAGDLAPGEKLTETDLAERMKISRGQLREAILQLTEEGLLVKEAWEKRTDAALADLKDRLDHLESARTEKDISSAVEGEIAFHSWVYELSGHGLLKSHWQRLVPLVQIYMSIHNRQHGIAGVFMDANHQYLTLVQGDDRTALLDHINEHMQKGMDAVFASLEATQ